MIEATRNQLVNINNPHQGRNRKVLCVCSAGLLRSPTLANVLHNCLGYNTRACGSAINFALIPISEALVYWADEIVFVDEECKDYLDEDIKNEIKNAIDGGTNVVTLNVPDTFDYNDFELKDILFEQYVSTVDDENDENDENE